MTEDNKRKVNELLMYGLWLRDNDVEGISIHKFGMQKNDALYYMGKTLFYENLQRHSGCPLTAPLKKDNGYGYSVVTLENITGPEMEYMYERFVCRK